MSEEAAATAEHEKPLWRRIVDFPLVAMLIAAVLFILVAGIGQAIGTSLPLHSSLQRMLVRNGLILALVLLTYKLAITRLGEHPRDDLSGKRALPDLGIGMLIGFLIMALSVGAAAIADVYNITGSGDSSQLVHELVASAIMPAFLEEIFFRGILFRWLEEFGGSFVALVLTSAMFGAAHLLNPNATAVAAFGIAIEAGVLLGGAYMLTRSLWLPIGLHAAWNFTQGEVFDVPVSGLPEHGLVQAQLSGPALLSGGGFGLEASIFAMIIATAAGVWLVWLAVKRGELVQPWWVRRRLSEPRTAR
jgi:membrane protease YdiL (CAAX protease family)